MAFNLDLLKSFKRAQLSGARRSQIHSCRLVTILLTRIKRINQNLILKFVLFVQAFYWLGPKAPEIVLRWAKLSPHLEREQKKAIADFDQLKTDLLELFQSAEPNDEPHLVALVRDIDLWLRYPKVSSTARTFSEAIAPFGAICDQLDKALNDLESTKRPKLFLVVDTSAIIDCPDATRMLASLGLSAATLVVPSTTIIELEDMKSSRRDDAFRRKLTAAIRYLNETMAKGDPLQGVVLSKDISLRMLAAEPDFLRLPTWLDSTIPDDRILGAAIEIQRDNPLSDVILVANDISMQNKAMLAKMQVKKVPNLSEEAA